MHRIGSEVQISGPCHGSVMKHDLRKAGWIGKRGKYPSLWRVHEPRHIHHTGETIGKCHLQPESWKDFDSGHTPGRLGRDLRCYGRGRIFIGI